ncbi:MAG: outer membrane protein transport protein [Verrucomicrobiota bacterium]
MLFSSGLGHAAESLSLIPDSAEALALAGARYANLQDASVSRVAPAAMLDFDRPAVLLNAALWRSDIGLKSTSGVSLDNDSPWVYPASFYAVVPLSSRNFAFGIGMTTPYGLGSEYSKTGPLRFQVPYESSLITTSITPSMAFRLTETVSAGLGLDFMRGDLQFSRLAPFGEIRLDAQGWGLGGFGNILWKITPNQRLSLVGRLPIRVDMDGDYQIFGLAPNTLRTSFETSMTFPGSVALGYGIDLTDRLTIGFDAKWINNSCHDDIPIRTGNLPAPAKNVPLQYKDSIDLGTAVSYKLNKSWVVRSGYLFSENSMPDKYFTPAIPAYDRHIFSLGLGWRGKSNRIDATYGFIFSPDRVVSGNVDPALNGTYRHQWHVLHLSFTHLF